jgi:HAAS
MFADELIADYLDALARELPPRSRRARRALQEIEAHLGDSAARLRRQGLTPEDAATAAIERFGTPRFIAAQFHRQAPVESEASEMIRHALTLLAALTTIMAGLLFVVSWFDDATGLAFAAKIAVSAAILGYNLLLVHQLYAAGAGKSVESAIAFAGALALIAIGSAGAVWTIHLGQTTGDWEMYGIVGGGLLAVQGVLAASMAAYAADGRANSTTAA